MGCRLFSSLKRSVCPALVSIHFAPFLTRIAKFQVKIVTFGKNTYFHVPSRNTSLYDECKLISQKKIGVTNFLVNRLDNKHPLHPNQVTRWALKFLPGMILTIFYRGTIKNCNLVKFDNKRGSPLEKPLPGLSPLMKFFTWVEASRCASDGKVTWLHRNAQSETASYEPQKRKVL